MVQAINAWLDALQTNGSSDTPPTVNNGSFWYDTGTGGDMRLRRGNEFLTVLHTGNSLALGSTAVAARELLGVARAQETTDDTSSGRGLIVGGFGVGGVAIQAPSNRFNNIVSSGFYLSTSATLQTPYGTGPSGLVLLAIVESSERQSQLLMDHRDTRVWFRAKFNGTFGSWNEIATSASLNSMLAAIDYNEIGSYSMLLNNTGGVIGTGATTAGSGLLYVSTLVSDPSPASPSGTWRCQSRVPAGAGGLFQRVA
jgi:hypothetical protein